MRGAVIAICCLILLGAVAFTALSVVSARERLDAESAATPGEVQQ